MKKQRFLRFCVSLLMLVSFGVQFVVCAEEVAAEECISDIVNESAEEPAEAPDEEGPDLPEETPEPAEEEPAEEPTEAPEEELPDMPEETPEPVEEEPAEEPTEAPEEELPDLPEETPEPAEEEPEEEPVESPEEESGCVLSLEGELSDVLPEQSYTLGIHITDLAEGKTAVVTIRVSDPALDGETIPLSLETTELTFSEDGVQYITVTVGSAEGLRYAGIYEGVLTAGVTEYDTEEPMEEAAEAPDEELPDMPEEIPESAEPMEESAEADGSSPDEKMIPADRTEYDRQEGISWQREKPGR